ncbi:MAG: hypothetical protein AB7S92_14940 [Parvibaculaceae bacterium]
MPEAEPDAGEHLEVLDPDALIVVLFGFPVGIPRAAEDRQAWSQTR